MSFYGLWFFVVAGAWWISLSPNANWGVVLIAALSAVLPAICAERYLGKQAE